MPQKQCYLLAASRKTWCRDTAQHTGRDSEAEATGSPRSLSWTIYDFVSPSSVPGILSFVLPVSCARSFLVRNHPVPRLTALRWSTCLFHSPRSLFRNLPESFIFSLFLSNPTQTQEVLSNPSKWLPTVSSSWPAPSPLFLSTSTSEPTRPPW